MSNINGSINGQFGSKLGFILASVGSAVGMGNIWMFPYRVGQYGGAAFLLVYFFFVALFGWVGLSGEFAFGRMTGTGPIGSYDYALKTKGKKGGKILGAIPLFGSLGIAIGYAIIVGWVLRFSVGSATGAMIAKESTEYFSEITGAFGSVPWHLCVVLMTIIFLIGGVTKGIEKINKFMMPAFFILFVVIAIRVAFLPGALEGYKYLLIPKWEYLVNPETWIMAMGQAFFSLSITGSGMIIYGSYLSKSEDIVHSALITALLDTCAALISGFAIIPAVFAFGLDPASGPPLMFITLPKVFAKMPMGGLFGCMFFISVLFAGLTSLMNMFEVCSEAAQTNIKLKRNHAVFLVGALVFIVGLFIEYEPYMGKWMDIITIYVVPIGAVLCSIMIYWVLGVKKIGDELALGAKKHVGNIFGFTAKYIYVFLAAAVVVLSIIYKGIG
ncbi:sodium-dependent transporter [Tyzzerella sp. An114]|uniref:sodium-dependent transporter n=1 Tax=Tyzzerella sp. An114 TaxID=1965545 RepID=UPI000B430177|nr:sodium-dependent transporter [Tyzzerella sp. An114]OUQ60420.1 sodium-dependent transporter [Tyzzerella sp. An114]